MRSVLLIDDEPFVGRAMARILEREHRVEVLSSAEEAIRRILAGDRWDAVVCDLLMPGMTGMDFADEIQRIAPDVSPRLIFMSGGACTERARAFLDRGVYVCLEKPVEPSDLREAVERLASRNGPCIPSGAPLPPA
jgi:DNA-binding NtrC family response regulator